MEIGKKLKDARMKSGFTQEAVAEKINVSRQTISNWENEKSYPDIISVIELSSLYSISLDDLLKGDERMMEHLEESTNVVKSNQKLIGAIILNIITVILLITLSMFLPDKIYYLIMVFCLAIVSSAVLLYQIIRRILGRNMMDKNIVLAVIFGAAAVVGAMETVYQIYRLTVMDAAARGLKHPKLWGLLAANGNNSSGLLLYLVGRRNYPMNSIDSRQLVVMEKRKKAAGIGLVFVAVGAIGLLVCLGRVGL